MEEHSATQPSDDSILTTKSEKGMIPSLPSHPVFVVALSKWDASVHALVGKGGGRGPGVAVVNDDG